MQYNTRSEKRGSSAGLSVCYSLPSSPSFFRGLPPPLPAPALPPSGPATPAALRHHVGPPPGTLSRDRALPPHHAVRPQLLLAGGRSCQRAPRAVGTLAPTMVQAHGIRWGRATSGQQGRGKGMFTQTVVWGLFSGLTQGATNTPTARGTRRRVEHCQWLFK